MPAVNLFNSTASLRTLHARVLFALAVLLAVLCGTQTFAAQAPATPGPSATPHKTAHKHKHPAPAPAPVQALQVSAVPVAPPTPEIPAWPANEKANHAAVTWDSHGLRIEAANSSLQQILKDVATETGAKVEGLDADERVFGDFGPGQARDVLSMVLQGSRYNVLMIGDQGQGTPREIVLTPRQSGTVQQAANPAPSSSSDDDPEPDDQPQPTQPPTRPGFGPPEHRGPQGMQRQQPPNTPNAPNNEQN
jgi:hypothetical protein